MKTESATRFVNSRRQHKFFHKLAWNCVRRCIVQSTSSHCCIETNFTNVLAEIFLFYSMDMYACVKKVK